MPKKSSKGQPWVSSRRSDDKHYFDHDDRDGRRIDNDSHFNGSRPRVSFKNVTKSNKKGIKNVGLAALKSLLDGDDVAMLPTTNGNNVSRIIGYRGRGRGGSGGYVNNRSRVDAPLREGYCYKIHIPYGKKYDKPTLVGLLHNSIQPDVFVPIMYKECEHDVIFYIDDFKVAKKLLSFDRKITTPDGFKIIIKVTQQSPPSKIDDVTKNRIRLAMEKRYSSVLNALDLSAFHHDCDLVSEYYFPLNRNNVLTEVLDIVGAVLPTLGALKLDKNNFGSIHKLSILGAKFANLKILHIGDNKITSLAQLEAVKELKLNELKLTGNPVCLRYKDRHENYVGDLRKIFPKLMKLDNIDLPPPILFDGVDDEVKFPETKTSFAVSLEAHTTATQFLKLYYECFDGESRQPLADAYNESASFSITVSSISSQIFGRYHEDNRDMMRTKDPIKRRRLLKQGKASIITYISSLPKTKHCLNSFTLDVTLDTGNMIMMTTTGLFKELNTKDEFIRYFSRTFIIVRQGAGWCIKNEQLSLSHPTPKQEKNIFKAIVAESTTPQQQQQQQQQVPSTSTPVELTTEMKQQMVIALSAATNMKLDWSEKCLIEQNWNYPNALSVFQEFFKLGQIPQDAFNK
ncbi:hypothetical protein HCN44_001395 [Aphidius gifuensis]|uniref:Nuclear RNA export factor 1 n=1 Tax=Aphidius gifuensis TaxID=684658 RepID=A0A834XRC7_APHGI|nr:hypothetical protein HCN44_001395 [Aphidius gifuensis]